MYEELKIKLKSYETDMNKKLSSLNQQFITNIHDKSHMVSGNKDLTVRLELREK